MNNPIEHPTPDVIRDLLKVKGITREKASGLVHVSLKTMHGWLSPIGGKAHRTMPLSAWELLLLKLHAHPDFELNAKKH